MENKTIKKPGRPKVVIDWSYVDAYLKAGGTGIGIAGLLGIHPNTLYDACRRDNKCDFSDYSQQKKAVGDDMLRAKQFDLAMKGSIPLLVWLGKQRLGQREKPRDPEEEQPNTPKNTTFTIIEELIEASQSHE